jgi:two-component system, NarL family, nitrate/nitrite response regulator NarL
MLSPPSINKRKVGLRYVKGREVRTMASLDPVVPPHRIGTVIVSEVRFLRECLAEILGRDPDLQVQGAYATLRQTLDATQAVRPEIMLLDAAFPGGCAVVRHVHFVFPETRVVAIAVAETEENILAWAEAGIAGYIPNTASLQDLTSLLKEIRRGEQSCSRRIAATLLRRVSDTERPMWPRALPAACLTTREVEILRLVGTGLSNKDIARRLGISLSTVKSHVHSLLGKMKLQRRTEVAALVNESM